MNPGARCQTPTRRSGSWNGSGFSSTPYTTLKIAVLAPIPKREREGGQSREAALLPQHARGVAQILREIGEQKPVGAPGVMGGGTRA